MLQHNNDDEYESPLSRALREVDNEEDEHESPLARALRGDNNQ